MTLKFQCTRPTAASQCLGLTETNQTVTNIRSHFPGKLAAWLQELVKYV